MRLFLLRLGVSPPAVHKRKYGEDAKHGVAFDTGCPTLATTPGEYTTFPEFPLLKITKRRRFNVVGDKIGIMYRSTTANLFDFITLHYGKNPAVYIHGPQGVGKSHSLYEVVCRLRQDASNRVIYIPDCGGWSDISVGTKPLETLLRAVAIGFPNDQTVTNQCDAVSVDDSSVWKLLEGLPEYCISKALKLYIVFDQHNGISPYNRTLFPFSIVEDALPSSEYWKKALIVVSASANNSYYLKVASQHSWPEFTLFWGFNSDEFQAWVTKEQFFEGDPILGQVAYWTGCIPYL